MEEEETEKNTSKYNAGLSQQYRMDGLWREFQQTILKGFLQGANWILDRIWGELSGDANEEELSNYGKFQKRFIKEKGDKDKLYIYLMERETFLRKAQNRQGKGTAYRETDDESAD